MEVTPDHTEEIETLKGKLVSVRRKRGRLLRRLGQRALDAILERRALDDQDPETQILVEDLQRNERELAFLLDRIQSLQWPQSARPGALPPAPGTDNRFPFSR